MNLLWKVQISLQQKLALAGIFSLTVFIMIVAIVRVVVISSASEQPDQTWLYMWSSIEQTVGMSFESLEIPIILCTFENNAALCTTAIVIACLASSRALFTKTDPSSRQASYQPKVTSRRHLFGSKESQPSVVHQDIARQPYAAIHTGVDTPPEAFVLKQPFEPTKEDFALNEVHIRHDVHVATSPV